MTQNDPIHWTGPHLVGENPTEKVWRLTIPGDVSLEVFSCAEASLRTGPEVYVFSAQVRGSEIALGGRLSLAAAQKTAMDALIDYAYVLAEASP